MGSHAAPDEGERMSEAEPGSSLLPIPRGVDATVAVAAPGAGSGNWAGAPSVVLHDGVYHLAYRVRAPLGHGRGLATVIARSVDGVRFEPVAEVTKDRFGAESLERPALVRTPDGPLAPLRQLRHAGQQALVGRRAGGRHPGGAGRRDAPDRAARGRRPRGEGPGDRARRRRLAPLGLGAPAGRGGPRGPDDHRALHERRRPALDPSRPRARPAAAAGGTPAGYG